MRYSDPKSKRLGRLPTVEYDRRPRTLSARPPMAPEIAAQPGGPDPAPLSPEATVDLLARVKDGDGEALDRLLARVLPPLKRWAHGRLPLASRGMLQTEDLIQETIMGAMGHLSGFEMRHQGALQAFLRTCVAHRLCDIARYYQRRPEPVPLPADLVDMNTSPLEQAIGHDNLDRYERALAKLSD